MRLSDLQKNLLYEIARNHDGLVEKVWRRSHHGTTILSLERRGLIHSPEIVGENASTGSREGGEQLGIS